MMARGGARAGAGRPNGIHTSWSHESQDRIRAKIQTESIIQRLNAFAAGEIKMEPAAVTAALGLLRKVIPDYTAVEHSGEITTNKVMRAPELSPSATDWAQNHTPEYTEH